MFYNAVVLPLGVIAVVCCVLVGAIAIISPRTFANLAVFWGTWINTRTTLPVVDKRIDIDEYVLRYPRVFGVLIVTAAAVWTVILAHTVS